MLQNARSTKDLVAVDVAHRASAPDLASFIDAARRRLGQLTVRAAFRRSLGGILVIAGACAATRPLLWASLDALPAKSFARACIFGGVPLCVLLAVVAVRAWRGRADRLAAARAVDRELGLAEVVASGFAFERDRRDDEMALFAIGRARRATAEVAAHTLFVWKPSARTKRDSRWLAAGVGSIVLGLAVGTLDASVVERAIHPATDREVAAAAALAKAVETVAKEPSALPAEQKAIADRMLEAARRASEAAKRGDRRQAREALEEMREASRALEAAQREQGRSLRALRDELEGKAGASGGAAKPGDAAGRRSATASEAMAKLAKELDLATGDETLRKMLERLDRAEASARAAAEAAGARSPSKSGSPSGGRESASAASAWSRAAAALKEAREAAARGDSEAAKRAMAAAEREMAALERASSDPSGAGQMTRMTDGAAELARSMHLATDASAGKKAGEGERGGAKAASGNGPSSRPASGDGDPSATKDGPGGRGAGAGPEQRRVNVEGNLQARADVRAGERAVSAIQGMGRGDDPRAYAEIFPSYDTVVEDGLREDVVPAAKQSAVRRYFSSIRPGSETDESRK